VQYRGWAKNGTIFCTTYNFIKYSPIFKIVHCQNQETICNKTITIDPTTSQVYRYTALWNITRRTQAGDATCVINVDRAFHLAFKQPGLKPSQLCGLGCFSTDGLSILTIYDSQPAEASDCHYRSIWFAPLVSGVAFLDVSSSSKSDTLNIWRKNCEIWRFRQ